MEHRCNRCGSTGVFLVANTYDNSFQGAGRLLSYCAQCRADRASQLTVAIPWRVVDNDPIGTLATLYAEGVTMTADPLGPLELPTSRWDELADLAGLSGTPKGDIFARHYAHFAERPWQRILRLGQALWREDRGLPIGYKDDTPIGSWIESTYARASGGNFLSPTIRERVLLDLATFKDGERVDQDHLFGNLLSSQALCYNLFAELAENLSAATLLARKWLDSVSRVTQIRFEFSPGRGDLRFTGTRSAFDVFVEYVTQTGGEGFIGIEMKYHESLEAGSQNQVRDRTLDVARSSGAFLDAEDRRLRQLPLSQLFLDHTLALSMLQDPESMWDEGCFCLMYPTANKSASEAAAQYSGLVRDFEQSHFVAMTLDDTVSSLRRLADEPWIRQFDLRYLRQWPLHFLDT